MRQSTNALVNALESADSTQVMYLIQYDIVDILCSMLTHTEYKIVMLGLDGLDYLLNSLQVKNDPETW